jgi:DNA polymerase-3 subunit delta'
MLFSEIKGKATIGAQIRQRIRDGRLPHAQLFSGKTGGGSLAMALATSQYLLCQNRSESDACGSCASCAKTRKLIHPDVHYSFPVVPKKSGTKPVSNDYMEEWRSHLSDNAYVSYLDWMHAIGAENKQGNITKEECRSIIQKLSLKAFESNEKVLIMWLPEYLGKDGNALLKLIEEPPANTYFILVTENPDNILPTILSRTQLVRIPDFTSEEIKSYVQEEMSLEPGKADTIAFLAEGDMNEALKLTDSTDSDWLESLKVWMRLCFRRDVPGLSQWCDQMGGKGRENIKNFLNYSLGVFREVLANQMITDYTIKLGTNEQQFVSNFSGVVQFTNIEVLYDGINRCIGEIERNANPKLTLFQLSLKLRDTFLETQKASNV